MNTRRLFRGAFLALALAVTVVACGDNAGNDAAGDAAGAGNADTFSGPTTTYESHGVVKKVDTEHRRVTLDHEQIADWMEPMTMPFPVADESLLEGLEVGKRYAFTVEVAGEDGEDYRITKLTPAP
jgi:Cu/Ag efflux protein CusF